MKIELDTTYEIVDPDAYRRITGKISMRYDSDDPLAVHFVFLSDDGRQATTWVFGRELLFTAFTRPAGTGDILIFDEGQRTHDQAPAFTMILSSPDGTAVMFFRKRDVRLFLERTFEIVPRNTEVIDVDKILEALLA